jgi:hypothetical protein
MYIDQHAYLVLHVHVAVGGTVQQALLPTQTVLVIKPLSSKVRSALEKEERKEEATESEGPCTSPSIAPVICTL